jgi:hypothetical protein
MGLLGMGLSMAATPPRAVPYSGAEIIGRSGLAGLGIYEKALEDKRRQDAMDISAEEHKLNREQLGMYRQGMLEDKAAKREIEAKKELSQSKIRTANALYRDAQRGKVEALNSLVDPDWAEAMGHPEWGGMTYDQMNRVSGPVVQSIKPEKMLPVINNGEVTYAPASEAAGQAVPQKAAQKYKNVPGVGMVDISGEKPFVAIKAPVFGKGGGVGGKPTANIQNIEYLVGNGWDRKEAEDVVLHGKRMPRENFIATMTKSIYGNEFIEDEDKPKKMEEAIKFYDSMVPQRGGGAKAPAAASSATETKVINGVTYYKRNGKWYDK